MGKKSNDHRPLPAVALLLAWLVPGAGHLYIGRAKRGVIIFVVVAATFWSGVAMGGAMTVDPNGDRWWFMADMLAGIHGLTGWRLSQNVYSKLRDQGKLTIEAPPPGVDPNLHVQMEIDHALKREGVVLVYPAETVARAYSGVAGLLNLICMFDATVLAVLGVTGERRREQEAAA